MTTKAFILKCFSDFKLVTEHFYISAGAN